MNAAQRPRFALIGAAGYIAPRHLQAIFENQGELVATCDIHDSVGILDKFFPKAAYFQEFERFDRFLEKLRQEGRGVQYVSICSPNYLHDAHVRFALRLGAHAICEKPLVINARNLDPLAALASETGKDVYAILQLREHTGMLRLREQVQVSKEPCFDVELTYITARGPWYLSSWKGNAERSGGLESNIGVHLFDVLVWIFGDVRECEVHARTPQLVAGSLRLERARVRWFLSIDEQHLPSSVRSRGKRQHRSLRVSGQEIDFTEGFSDLHTLVYRRILEGGGFSLEESKAAIDLACRVRSTDPAPGAVEKHPLLDIVGL